MAAIDGFFYRVESGKQDEKKSNEPQNGNGVTDQQLQDRENK